MSPPFIPLTTHHIHFTGRAITPIRFGEFKGSALRGALVSVLRRTFCPASGETERDPHHLALCPVCQLLQGDGDEESGGDVRRPYAIEPVLDDQLVYAPGDPFAFGVALYGESWSLFPFVALAAGGMGEFGVGQRGDSGRGRFVIEAITSVNPLTGEHTPLLAPGERMVRSVTLPVTHAQVLAAAEQWATRLAAADNRLVIDFLTPTRITQDDHTAKGPAFFPLAKKIVLRVLDLCAQQGGGRPDVQLKSDLYPAADTVQLVRDETHWWDLKGYSSRLGRGQVLGGFVGRAVYSAPDWRPLLPWLLWGVSTHVGKNVVKGCGIYRLA